MKENEMNTKVSLTHQCAFMLWLYNHLTSKNVFCTRLHDFSYSTSIYHRDMHNEQFCQIEPLDTADCLEMSKCVINHEGHFISQKEQ